MVQEGALLCDLGSCAQHGRILDECTAQFGLGLEPQASLQWDLTCLATTSYQLASATTRFPGSTEQLLADISAMHNPNLGCRLAQLILANSTCAVHEVQSRIWEPALSYVHTALGETAAARMASWWPTERK